MTNLKAGFLRPMTCFHTNIFTSHSFDEFYTRQSGKQGYGSDESRRNLPDYGSDSYPGSNAMSGLTLFWFFFLVREGFLWVLRF